MAIFSGVIFNNRGLTSSNSFNFSVLLSCKIISLWLYFFKHKKTETGYSRCNFVFTNWCLYFFMYENIMLFVPIYPGPIFQQYTTPIEVLNLCTVEQRSIFFDIISHLFARQSDIYK